MSHPGHDLLLWHGIAQRRRTSRWVRRRPRRGFGQFCAMGDDRLLHGLGEVLPQVEPVSYLDRGRGSLPSSVGITSATVAADHLDTRMLAQPLGQAGAVATLENLDQPMPAQIDQDGPITA